MQKVFPAFSEGFYSRMTASEQAIQVGKNTSHFPSQYVRNFFFKKTYFFLPQIIVLFGLVPFLRRILGWHETT